MAPIVNIKVVAVKTALMQFIL